MSVIDIKMPLQLRSSASEMIQRSLVRPNHNLTMPKGMELNFTEAIHTGANVSQAVLYGEKFKGLNRRKERKRYISHINHNMPMFNVTSVKYSCFTTKQ